MKIIFITKSKKIQKKKNFVQKKKYFVQKKKYFVQKKKYFVQKKKNGGKGKLEFWKECSLGIRFIYI